MFNVVENVKYISHSPVMMWKKPMPFSPKVMVFPAVAEPEPPSGTLAKNSVMYTPVNPANSTPTGQPPAPKNTTMPSTEIMVNAIDIPPFGRGSDCWNRFQPSANQWIP